MVPQSSHWFAPHSRAMQGFSSDRTDSDRIECLRDGALCFWQQVFRNSCRGFEKEQDSSYEDLQDLSCMLRSLDVCKFFISMVLCDTLQPVLIFA